VNQCGPSCDALAPKCKRVHAEASAAQVAPGTCMRCLQSAVRQGMRRQVTFEVGAGEAVGNPVSGPALFPGWRCAGSAEEESA
jgi:hypothetical protein